MTASGTAVTKELAGPLVPLPISAAEAELAVARSLTRPHDVDVAGTVVNHVMRHAATSPDTAAVTAGAVRVSYRELGDRVAAVRRHLVAEGCGPGDVVAALGRRGVETVVLFLALESIGAVYVPADPGWPLPRLRSVIGRSGAGWLVAYGVGEPAGPSGELLDRLRPAALLVLDETWSGRAPDGELRPRRVPGGELRYLIYTSGTTGVPKGAGVTHHGMMNHLWSKVVDLELTGRDVVAFTAPLVFDIAIWQMLAPLLTGGTVAVLTDDEMAFPRPLCRAIRHTGTTVAEFVPAVVGWLVDGVRTGGAPPDLRWLISTGEELPPSLAERAMAALPGTRLLNAYGPTECSDDVTHHVIGPDNVMQARLPVGGPVINAALYVLVPDGDRWRAAAEGEAGELFVGGLPVGTGYPDDPEATRAAFFRDVLAPDSPTGRLYRTGDAARIVDGLVYCLGRLDRQVKVAGVRIELGEIESVVNRHPTVSRCAVVVEAHGGHPELVAYCVTAGVPLDAAALARHAGERLPAAMIPRQWNAVDVLPLTPNGKIDYKALRRAEPPVR
jgi:D-alanine--poly(phosphoribitol) ligase subunit 1